MLTRRTLCFLSAALFLRCDRTGISAPQTSKVEPVEAQIIESVLQLSNVEPVEAQIIESVLHHLDERKGAATFMHLSAEARLDETLKNRAKSRAYLREKLGKDDESLNRLFDRNSVSHRWPQNIALPEGFQLDARGEIDELFTPRAGGWKEYDRRYPTSDGIVTLSLPGVSADRKTAAIYAALLSGPLAGRGRVFLLKRDGETWKITASVEVWVS